MPIIIIQTIDGQKVDEFCLLADFRDSQVSDAHIGSIIDAIETASRLEQEHPDESMDLFIEWCKNN